MALIKCPECGTEISDQAAACVKCGHPLKKVATLSPAPSVPTAPPKQNWWLIILVILAAPFFLPFLRDGAKSDTSSSSSSVFSDTADSKKKSAIGNLRMDYHWIKDGFGSTMTIDLDFKNNGYSEVKDIEVTCEHTANSGTRIDSNKRVIYESIPIGGTKTIKGFSMGFINSQVTRTSCKVTDLVLI